MGSKINVVIVEDDPMVLELHRQYILKLNKLYQLVGCAQTGEEGLELITKENPQLAIFDIYLPGINGLAAVKKIRNEGFNTDVILVTAAHNTESIQQGIQYGALDYIVKPFTFQRFKKALINYYQYINKLRASPSLSQRDIDMLKRSSNDSGEAKIAGGQDASKLPKGLQRSTMEVIVNMLRRKKNYFTVQEISQCSGISRVTVRRYLQYLNEAGMLKEMLSYGPVGRPMQKFIVNEGVFWQN